MSCIDQLRRIRLNQTIAIAATLLDRDDITRTTDMAREGD